MTDSFNPLSDAAFDFHVHCRGHLPDMASLAASPAPGPFVGWFSGLVTLDAFMMVGYARVLPGFLYRILAPVTWRAIERRLQMGDVPALERIWKLADVIGGVVCPVEPHLHNADALEAAGRLEDDEDAASSLIVRAVDPCPMKPGFIERLREGRGGGASVLKLHPLSGGYAADGPDIVELVKTAHSLGMSVQIHTGGYPAMFGNSSTDGGIQSLLKLASACDEGHIHMVHANLFEPLPMLSKMISLNHVTFGLSFKDSATIRRMADMVGPSRLLYESDWPMGDPLATRHQVTMAFDSDKSSQRMILFENAMRILDLPGLSDDSVKGDRFANGSDTADGADSER
ncbi:MAG: hypothetical protein CVV64_13690 [Candidatus Wallbacteria bacterium HGW-Wallbacteria-1]|jgi:hypothetical protein|uniref:Amidohydrolase-related domain-containing protein n=1 Tax=Candidatus Wallbacteria bacterium HGW-Wallbacteria-1 TaxID=2013854 RepID=A0A2N1PMN4_9BACT|nr:MAG: hypothetical protein CVV64_13690 [Candidatus Wallbacteria bacterium HGW-Wallbacteria-1]